MGFPQISTEIYRILELSFSIFVSCMGFELIEVKLTETPCNFLFLNYKMWKKRVETP